MLAGFVLAVTLSACGGGGSSTPAAPSETWEKFRHDFSNTGAVRLPWPVGTGARAGEMGGGDQRRHPNTDSGRRAAGHTWGLLSRHRHRRHHLRRQPRRHARRNQPDRDGEMVRHHLRACAGKINRSAPSSRHPQCISSTTRTPS